MNMVNSKVHIFYKVLFILTVLLVYPLPQFAVDLYTPSWLSMAEQFHVTHAQIQFTLTVYLFSLGVSQLIYGPLSDIFGRKPVLLTGCTIFLVATPGCAFSHSIGALYFYRILQGLGLGCGFTVASAILADIYSGRRLAQMTSYSAMVYSSAIIMAPFLGGYIQHYLGWRYTFVTLFVYGLVLVVMILFYIRETNVNKADKKHIIKDSFSKYGQCFSNLYFMSNVFGLTISYALIIAVSIITPFLLMKQLHVSVVIYGDLLAAVGIAYFLGATVNSQLVKKTSVYFSTNVGLFFMFCGSGLLSFLFFKRLYSPELIVLSCSLSIFGVGFFYPNCFAGAMDVFDGKGTSGAFLGAFGVVGTSIISLIISQSTLAQFPLLVVTFFILSLLCFICCLVSRGCQSKQSLSCHSEGA
jgi:Bcr/CflA subfamily drug resistance transporter